MKISIQSKKKKKKIWEQTEIFWKFTQDSREKQILILSQTIIFNLITVFNKNGLAINLLANSIREEKKYHKNYWRSITTNSDDDDDDD